MKQHITVEQLNELSRENKKKLRDIFPCDHPHCICGHRFDAHEKGSHPYIEEIEPLLSIGQMIEFLDENNSWILGKTSTWHGGGYSLSIGKTPTELTQTEFEKNIRQYQEKELCDALWEAVKKVLKNEKLAEKRKK